MRFNTAIVKASLVVSLFGCGGSGTASYSFVGDWRAIFNIVTDDCGLFEVGADSFSDNHSISETGAEFLFTSELGLPSEAEGMIAAKALPFSTMEDIDVFGDGTPCVLEQQVTYSDLKSSEATVVYTFKILCSAQLFCSTTAVGSAIR